MILLDDFATESIEKVERFINVESEIRAIISSDIYNIDLFFEIHAKKTVTLVINVLILINQDSTSSSSKQPRDVVIIDTSFSSNSPQYKRTQNSDDIFSRDI